MSVVVKCNEQTEAIRVADGITCETLNIVKDCIGQWV